MAKAALQKPKLLIMAADWSLREYPSAAKPWSIQTKVQKVKGMNVCIVTTAKTDEEARALLTALGMPFRKN